MSANLQQIIDRILAGHATEADLQVLIAAIQSGQVVLATAARSIAAGGSVSDSVIITGDNNQVILLKEAAAIAIEQLLQQWQPKQGRYVKPKGCQNQQECDRYLEQVLQRLEKLGNPEILKDEYHRGRRFNYIARMIEFEIGLAMRGEAFFLFSEFAILSANGLQQFSAQCLQIAKVQADPKAVGRAFYNVRFPAHVCFAIALVDQLDDATRNTVCTTNPFKQRVDLLWYEVPVVYELNRQQLCYYNQPSNFWEHFRGEIAWQRLRTVIQRVLTP
jgi:Effector-associated domain 10